jgi:tetratricopeptide (TPR) repeat protein
MAPVDELMSETTSALRAGDFARAQTLTGQILEIDPDNEHASELKAVLSRGRAASASLRPFGRQMTVTFLYSELGSHGGELMGGDIIRENRLRSAYYDAASQVVDRYDGHIVSYRGESGSGLLIAFGYPTAHEDDARRAVHAALGIENAVERLEEASGGGTADLPRIGLHTGLATPDPHDPSDLFSLQISTVERIQEKADPGAILISEDTARRVSGFFETEDLGDVALRSLPDPMGLRQVTGPSGVEDRLDAATMLTPLVGRATARTRLLETWEAIRSGESGAVALITGDAGIGKSRLAQFIRDRAAFDGHATLRAHCSPYYKLAGFHAISRMMATAFEVDKSMLPDERLERLASRLDETRASLPDLVPLLAPLLDIPSEREDGTIRYEQAELERELLSARTIGAVVEWWRALASHSPAVVVIEDLHWADRSTLRIVEELAVSEPVPGVMLVVTARPALSDSSWLGDFAAGLGAHEVDDVQALTTSHDLLHGGQPDQVGDHVLSVGVERLSSSDVEAMIDAMPTGRDLSRDRREKIVQLADGVPLFVEELVRTGSDLPQTVEELLQARVQKAGDDLQTLQIASVIGTRRVRTALLEAVIASMIAEEGQTVPDRDRWLVESLDRLVDGRLLERHRGEEKDSYRFRHALIRDATYETIAEQERVRIHGHVAEQLEGGADGEPNPATVALHHERAGNGLLALRWYSMAASEAFDAGSATEAIDSVDRALALVDPWPPSNDKSLTQMQLLMLRGGSYQSLEGYGSARAYEDFSTAQRLSDSLRERHESAGLVMALNAYRSIRGEREEAERIVTQLEDVLESTRETNPDEAARFEADVDFNKGLHEFFLGNWDRARSTWERSLYGPNGFESRADHLWEGQTPPSDPHAGAFAQLIPVYWVQGEMSRADEAYRAAMGLAGSQDFPHGPFMRAYAHTYMGWTHQLSHDPQSALQEFGAAVGLGTQHGFAMWQGFGGFGALVAQLYLEFSADVLAELDSLMGQAMEAGTWAFGGYYGGQRAWFEHVKGESEAALDMFDGALGLSAEKREQHSDAYVRCMKARVLLTLGRAEEALAELTTAYDLALTQKAYVFGLEAAWLIGNESDASLDTDDRLDRFHAVADLIPEADDYLEIFERVPTEAPDSQA